MSPVLAPVDVSGRIARLRAALVDTGADAILVLLALVVVARRFGRDE